MFQFIFDGGVMITIPLTILLFINIFLIGRYGFGILGKSQTATAGLKSKIDLIKYLAVVALTVGIFGQIIGLYSAFEFIESAGNISQGIFFSGLRVSSITTLYGFSIFLFSFISWILLKMNLKQGISDN